MDATPGPVRLLAVDVGNSTVKCAVLRAGAWQVLMRVPTWPVEGLSSRLTEALPHAEVASLRGARCVAASVCPPADVAVAAFAQAAGAAPAAFFGRDLPVPIPAKLLRPEEAGVDRLLLALGAREGYGSPCIVVSAGTAVTVDLVDADGAFAGGAIAPGFALAARALHEGTALLPLVEPARPHDAVGRATAEALRSGVYWSCAGGVRALARQYGSRPGCRNARIVLTGADAPLLLPALPRSRTRHVPDLIFRGMAAATAPAALKP
jgi:type III pantothenate kinase